MRISSQAFGEAVAVAITAVGVGLAQSWWTTTAIGLIYFLILQIPDSWASPEKNEPRNR